MSSGTRGKGRSGNGHECAGNRSRTASAPEKSRPTRRNGCRQEPMRFNVRTVWNAWVGPRRPLAWNRPTLPYHQSVTDCCLAGRPRVDRSRHSTGYRDSPGRSRHTPSILQPRRRIRRSWIAFLAPFRHSLHNRPFLLLGCRAPVDDLVERTQAPYANKASLIEATTVDARRNDCLGVGR